MDEYSERQREMASYIAEMTEALARLAQLNDLHDVVFNLRVASLSAKEAALDNDREQLKGLGPL